MRLFTSWLDDRKERIVDRASMSEFFFGHEANPRTRLPGADGWVKEVNARFDDVDTSLANLAQSVQLILEEVKPDGNGGHNLRGAVDRAAGKNR